MDFQSIVSEVTGRAEKIAAQGQEVAIIGLETLKTANGIVVEGVQAIVKTNTDGAVALFGEAKTSFEKATTDGVQAVIASPVAYLPATGAAVEAFNSTVKTLTETGSELAKTFEGGFNSIKATITGEASLVAPVATAQKAAKSAEASAKKTVKAAAKKVKAATAA